ncbi:hypothetical protein IV203_028622 [Nitzschia inconspicua]|uniref:Uncharacterized protein n=1 Tax=Nitzschia inconspicua TaxID=303405 RepID=A0A9K3K7C8_9STRA|nr:hypothetical protein IV203_004729 [Nitzschia inconspicua]KAG7365952.1 hypothetical protein IV203_028622 [Nitzschia inconspicua]
MSRFTASSMPSPTVIGRHFKVEYILIVAIVAVMSSSFWIGSHAHGRNFQTMSFLLPQNTTDGNTNLGRDDNNSIMHVQNPGLWRNNPNIPSWLQEYMEWHHGILTHELTNATKRDYNYLVLRCYSFDERCGGVSDRLKPVPLILLAAAKSQRMLFIHWYQRPYPLEEFLLPPPGGFNWSVPNFLVEDFLQQKRGAITRASMVLRATQKEGWIKTVHIHDAQGGSPHYDEVNGPNSFLNVFHDVFRILFQPSPGLAAIIQQKLHGGGKDHTAQLVPGRYSVAHYRAEYGREVNRHPKLTEPSFIQTIALNAIRCAIELQPGYPIYFASDNMIALNAVRRLAAFTKYPIVTFDRDEDIVLTLDDVGMELSNVTDYTTKIINPYRPKDYYSTFVDLYLAGNGDCVTFGRGGFGRFANLISYNATCAFKHVNKFYAVPCRGHPPLDKTDKQLADEGFHF